MGVPDIFKIDALRKSDGRWTVRVSTDDHRDFFIDEDCGEDLLDAVDHALRDCVGRIVLREGLAP